LKWKWCEYFLTCGTIFDTNWQKKSPGYVHQVLSKMHEMCTDVREMTSEVCLKSLKMTNIVTVVLQLEKNHCQLKDFLCDMESECKYVLCYVLNIGRMVKPCMTWRQNKIWKFVLMIH
jgi:hypothetical protein